VNDFRPGDIVTVELEIKAFGSRPCLHVNPAGPDVFARLVDAGKVTLVRRAEPDWKPGDIGQHIETGVRYLYRPYYGRLEDNDLELPGLTWLPIGSLRGLDVAFRSAEELAGKLVRCTVTPEVAS
jgi:hypothetical protein